eukprot:TRINITY_DN8782_c0_g3_i1.p1 TRINITY_DN8782_c0_g3~~TRINITY_DN8782_c0_g3_i1.p1  ORF type:complete len:470 (+),score=32.72 TRINITY_DN8782_c0_g3_i1:72-1412(+)
MTLSTKVMQGKVGNKSYSKTKSAHLASNTSIRWPYKHRYFITCHPGLEQVVAEELRSAEISAPHVEVGKAGVYFSGDDDCLGYRVSFWSRAGIKVLQLLAEGEIDPSKRGADQVYEFCRGEVNWQDYIPVGTSINWRTNVHECTDIRTPVILQQRLRDAVCDHIRDTRGTRPPPPEQEADIPLHAVAHRDYLMLYRQLNYGSLHKRGYKSKIHKASLNESAACGLLYLAGWNKANDDAVLMDPMCGSGTIVIEAALMAKRIAPGLLRKGFAWPFVKWVDFQPDRWKHMLQEAVDIQSQNKWKGKAVGVDEYKESVLMAQDVVDNLKLRDCIKIRQGSCGEVKLARPPDFVVSNPPWGIRLKLEDETTFDKNYNQEIEESSDLQDSWKQLGNFLKTQCPGVEAYILSGNKNVTKYLRLQADQRFPVTIGGVNCRLIKYKIGMQHPKS